MAIDKTKLVYNFSTGTFDVVQDVSGLLPKDGSESMTGELNLGSSKIINVANPTSDQDAATKKYVDDEIAGLPNPITYKGTWNANTNTPTLSNSDTDVEGFLYQVSVAGSVNFGAGSINFEIGDKVVNNGTSWEKWDMTDAVLSVNGQSGIVSLDTDDIPEGTALYFTDARARAAISSTAPITYSSGNIGITQATTSVDGFLSATDWNVFNGKFSLPSLTAGSVLFSDGTTIAQDNTNLNFNDATNVLSVPTVKDPASSRALSLTSGTLSNSSAQTTVDFQNRQLTEGTFIGASWSSLGLDLHDSVNGSNRNISNIANMSLGSNGVSYAVQSSTRQTSVPGSGGIATINMSTRYAAIVHYSAKDSAGGGYNKTGTLHIAKEHVGNNTNAAITDTGAATNANMDLLTFSINGSGDLLTTNGTSATLTINFMITYL